MPRQIAAMTDAPDPESESERLRRELAARDRELAESRAMNEYLERRVIGANRTLAYGLGKALIEARSVKGLAALPGKLRRLRLRQQVKRRARVEDSGPAGAAALLRHVDPALDRLRVESGQAAAGWVRALPERESAAKARALAELAVTMATEEAVLAGKLGQEAAAIDPGMPRLLTLARLLREGGAVTVPAGLARGFRASQTVNEALAGFIDALIEDARILSEGHPDRQMRDVRLAANRAKEIAVVYHAGDGSDWRIAQTRTAADQAGLVCRIVEAEKFTLDPAARPPGLVHILIEAPEAARRALTVARLAGSPVLLDIAGLPEWLTGHGDCERTRVAQARIEWLTASANSVAARGKSLAEALAAQTGAAPEVAAETVDLVAVPLDKAACDAAAAEFEITGRPAIGCFATLDGEPGLSRLIEGFAGSRLSNEAELHFFGRGAGGGVLLELAAQFGIGERVRFGGLPSAVRWPALMRSLDLIVFPRALPEAAGSGLCSAIAVAEASGARLATTPALAAWADVSLPLLEGDDWGEALTKLLKAKPRSPAAHSDSGNRLAAIYARLAAL